MNEKIKIGINGLGRIGRHILRLAMKDPRIKVVGINDINPDIGNWAYTINYDTIYGKSKLKFIKDSNKLRCNEQTIETSNKKNISQVDWDKWMVDIVVDCTGVKKNVLNSRKLVDKDVVDKVLISHSPDEVDFTMILGVNEDEYDPKNHNIIASSICDATAIAPITKIINNSYGIKNGYVTTLHPWLNYQNLMDGPSSSWSMPDKVYHHYALGRSSIGNMIPKPTSAMEAVFKVIPSLSKENIGSFSYRTPTQIIASADITYFTNRDIDKKSLIDLFLNYSKKQKFPIIKISNEPLVSLDFVGEEYSAIIDSRWINVIDKNLLKIVLWYDNEYGYASNMINQINYIGNNLKIK